MTDVVLAALLIALALFLIFLVYRRGFGSGMKAMQNATESHRQQLAQELEFAKQRWTEEETRAQSFSKIVAGILHERDDWRDLYFANSIAHGNAQGMMMSFIEHQQQALKR